MMTCILQGVDFFRVTVYYRYFTLEGTYGILSRFTQASIVDEVAQARRSLNLPLESQ